MMTYPAAAVVNNFIEVSTQRNDPVTHMKLQKLVYFAHGWHLALNDAPLIQEGVEAWKYGPVVVSLYHQFKDLGLQPINRKAAVVNYANGTFDEPHVDGSMGNAVIDRVWEIYGGLTAIQLANFSHENGSPWHAVVSACKPGELPPHLEIPDELIADYFKKQMAT